MRLTAVVVLSACAVACSATRATEHAFLRDCEIPGSTGRALCGAFEVPENRERPGRTIPLNLVVLKATGGAGKPDPFVPVQGGPGQGATALAGLYSRLLSDIRRERDILLVDVRGTGKSNPLGCDATSADWLRSGELFPAALIRACRETLQKRADLTQYTTTIVARDLDDVRKALGIERWNLYGTSYGTRLAQEYVRAYGAHVRTVTLSGVVPPSMAIPLPYARDSQAALDKLLDKETRELLPVVMARLRAEPARVPAAAGEMVISEGVFAEALRNLIYNAWAASTATAMIREAADGNFMTAADAVMQQRRGFTEIALGMFLSVTCAEDIPRIDPSGIEDATRGTFLRDYRVRQQISACREWSAGAARADAFTAVRSDVPALLISGEVDPVTPPRFGEEVLATFRNGLHITLPGAGHGFGNAGCVGQAMTQFVETGNLKGLNLSCVGNISPR